MELNNHTSDLHVSLTSTALRGVSLDVVVTGSIAALQAPLFIRSLRRLGAEVYPVLSSGGSKFITPLALEWAAGNSVTTDFTGLSTHLCTHDAVIIAPASANTISSIAQGLCSSPSLALISSALGQNKPIFVLPAMHASLFASPIFQKNLASLKEFATLLASRVDEGKYKFPEPKDSADEVAHYLNQKAILEKKPVVVTLGGTQAPLDAVRSLGNYSSGTLGSLIAEELYRRGINTWVIAGKAERIPAKYWRLTRALEHSEMQKSCETSMKEGAIGLVMAAAILDYVPDRKIEGKVPSEQENISLTLKKTSKILDSLQPASDCKVAFKLVSKKNTSMENWDDLARTYFSRYGLSMLVINYIEDVSSSLHKARTYENLGNIRESVHEFQDKETLAQHIAQHVITMI